MDDRGLSLQFKIDPEDLLVAWSIRLPRSVRPSATGTNNRSYIVETDAGTYYLRVYLTTNELERIRYEHALLRQLQSSRLAFAVPLPLSTITGTTCFVTSDGGKEIVAALFPAIPGHKPTSDDAGEAAICGEALGELDRALARIKVESSFGGLPWLGQPGLIHALVPDPLAAAEQLPLDTGTRERLNTLLYDLRETSARLYPRLPEQIIHGDFFPSNVLLQGNNVSGVLDF